MILQTAKELLWTAERTRRQAKERKKQDTLRKQVLQCIRDDQPPQTDDSERDYEQLCAAYSGPGEYGYGERPNWLRGTARARQILEAIPSLAPAQRALEVGCGDGMTAVALQSFGIQVELTDLNDWRDPRAVAIPFAAIDLDDRAAPLPCGPYDLIYSYNAFEHFPDPASVLERMLVQLNPGGHLFFEFGPLYSGPWGLHAYRMIPMPYPQFLFRESFWRSKLAACGVRDLGQELEDLQPLNRWTVRQFDALWEMSGCEVLRNERYRVESFLALVSRYPKAFRGRGLEYQDLTTQGLCILMKKPL